MKLGVVYWTISSLISAAGLGLMIGGAVMHGANNERISFTETAKDFSGLDISLEASTLELRSSEKTDVCTVEFQDVSKSAGISVENDVLFIRDKQRFFMQLFHFDFLDLDNEGKVIVTMPEAEYEKVRISLGLADDNSIRKLDCRQLQLDMGVGDLEIEKLEVFGEFLFSGGTGNLDIETLDVAGKLEMELGTGSIEMQDCRFDSDLSIDAGTGDFRCKDITVLGNLDADLGVGDLKLEKFEVKGTCEFDCGMGNIEVSKGKFHGISMDCGAGNVTMKNTKFLDDMEISQGAGNITIEIDGEPTAYWLDIDQGVGTVETGGIPMGNPLQEEAHVIRVDGGAGNIRLSVTD